MIQPENYCLSEEEGSSNFATCECVDTHNGGQQLPIAASPFVKYAEQPSPVRTTQALEVVHIVDPSNFYCQLIDHKRQLDDLMNELASFYGGIFLSFSYLLNKDLS